MQRLAMLDRDRAKPVVNGAWGIVVSAGLLLAAVAAAPMASSQAAPVAAAPSTASALVPLRTHPDGLEWPTTNWPTGPLAADVDASGFAAVAEAGFQASANIGQTRALLVIHRGRLVYERYAEGFGPNTRQVSWSVAKSITHAALGRAVERGEIKDINTAPPGPWEQTDARAAISWDQWMQMVDGLSYVEIGAKSIVNDVSRMMFGQGRRDAVGWFSGQPLGETPGQVWNYSTGGVHLLSKALADTVLPADQRLSGSQREGGMRAWLELNLFGPLGMDAVAEFDAAGTFLGGSLVWAKPRDFAKFGYLYLRDGIWEGQRLLPVGWVDNARTPGSGTNSDSYGRLFWLTPSDGGAGKPRRSSWIGEPRDGFHAQGFEGQMITIVPSRDLVVVRMGLMANGQGNWDRLYDWTQTLLNAFPPEPQTSVSASPAL